MMDLAMRISTLASALRWGGVELDERGTRRVLYMRARAAARRRRIRHRIVAEAMAEQAMREDETRLWVHARFLARDTNAMAAVMRWGADAAMLASKYAARAMGPI